MSSKRPTKENLELALRQIDEYRKRTAEDLKRLKEEQDKFAKAQEARDGSISGAFQTLLESFKEMQKTAVVMTPEQEAQQLWLTVRRNLRAKGWQDKHLRRIHPKWGNADQAMAFDLMSEMLRHPGAIVFLCGARGTGKTQMAEEHSRLQEEASVVYWNTPEMERMEEQPIDAGRYEKLTRLTQMFKSVFGDFGSITKDRDAALYQSWVNADLVVIDEVHEVEDAKIANRMLVDLVDCRYAKNRRTILISNHEPEKLAASVSPSIMSRLSETGGIIPCMWPSWRAN